jgi:hypothetical protein
MENNITYTTFFNQVKESITDGTFAKLTLAKTVGKPELQNIYVRTIVVDSKLKLSLTFKIYKDGLEEIVKECEIEDMQKELVPFMNNPFLTALLFTTEKDVTVKLNKRREANITEKEPTFKHASAELLEFLGM